MGKKKKKRKLKVEREGMISSYPVISFDNVLCPYTDSLVRIILAAILLYLY